ncbi:hypothetical protein [Rhizobium bangladeshense]|nr:hypothetical protein [Rhizobium bangladeshense]
MGIIVKTFEIFAFPAPARLGLDFAWSNTFQRPHPVEVFPLRRHVLR